MTVWCIPAKRKRMRERGREGNSYLGVEKMGGKKEVIRLSRQTCDTVSNV